MSEIEQRKLEILDREVRVKERELDHTITSTERNAWKSPLVVAIFAAALGAFGNAVTVYYNSYLDRQAAATEHDRSIALSEAGAENDRILEMIKIGDPEQVQRNLEFLIETELVKDPHKVESIVGYYKNRVPGTDPGASEPLPAAEFPVTLTGFELAVFEIAERRLSSVAGNNLHRLLGGKTLVSSADLLPPRAAISEKTYVVVPRGSKTIDLSRDCQSNCSVSEAVEMIELLSESAGTRERQAEAIARLSYAVANIHLPFHVSYSDDRGWQHHRGSPPWPPVDTSFNLASLVGSSRRSQVIKISTEIIGLDFGRICNKMGLSGATD